MSNILLRVVLVMLLALHCPFSMAPLMALAWDSDLDTPCCSHRVRHHRGMFHLFEIIFYKMTLSQRLSCSAYNDNIAFTRVLFWTLLWSELNKERIIIIKKKKDKKSKRQLVSDMSCYWWKKSCFQFHLKFSLELYPVPTHYWKWVSKE